jgi:hypothetical protein
VSAHCHVGPVAAVAPGLGLRMLRPRDNHHHRHRQRQAEHFLYLQLFYLFTEFDFSGAEIKLCVTGSYSTHPFHVVKESTGRFSICKPRVRRVPILQSERFNHGLVPVQYK